MCCLWLWVLWITPEVEVVYRWAFLLPALENRNEQLPIFLKFTRIVASQFNCLCASLIPISALILYQGGWFILLAITQLFLALVPVPWSALMKGFCSFYIYCLIPLPLPSYRHNFHLVLSLFWFCSFPASGVKAMAHNFHLPRLVCTPTHSIPAVESAYFLAIDFWTASMPTFE